MALVVVTAKPKTLLRKIREAITDGVVTTWRFDADGDFTHTSEQWGRRVWLRPVPGEGELVLRTVPRQERHITTTDYAYYHGHFAQMLLAHFDDDFVTVKLTASPTRGDRIGK